MTTPQHFRLAQGKAHDDSPQILHPIIYNCSIHNGHGKSTQRHSSINMHVIGRVNSIGVRATCRSRVFTPTRGSSRCTVVGDLVALDCIISLPPHIEKSRASCGLPAP